MSKKASDLGNVDSVRGHHKPNFFIIGSMKSATTYLWRLLASHPSIFMCNPKEPSYFVEPTQLQTLWPWGWEQGYWKCEERYLELFQLAGTATILGEASVHYTYAPLASGVPEKLHQFNPAARLIYVMRDPIERTISHYWHRVRWLGEARSLSSAIKDDPQYRDVSYYAMQLAPYFRLFGQHQMKTLTFEQLVRSPTKSILSIIDWLNLDSSLLPPIPPAENATPDIVEQRIGGGVLYGLRDNSRILRAVIDHAPASIRRLAVRMVTRRISRASVDISETVQYLRPLQRRQTEELTQLLGRGFPEWTTLNPP